MADEPRTFDEAVGRFERFLNDNGYSPHIIWIEPADLVLPGGRSICVKQPVPARNATNAHECFERGMKEGRGITFGTICEVAGSTCCYAWVPKYRNEQERHLMGRGLKMKAGTRSDNARGVAVTCRLRWWFLRIRHQQRSRRAAGMFG